MLGGRGPLRGPAQALDFGSRQPAVVPGREVAEAQRPEGDPPQDDDAVADRFAHAPHLALVALVDGQLELVRADEPHARGRRAAVVELDALAQGAQRALARTPLDPRAVGPRN